MVQIVVWYDSEDVARRFATCGVRAFERELLRRLEDEFPGDQVRVLPSNAHAVRIYGPGEHDEKLGRAQKIVDQVMDFD